MSAGQERSAAGASPGSVDALAAAPTDASDAPTTAPDASRARSASGASWGRTILQAQTYFQSYPLYLWEPLIGIVLLVLSLNLLGDAIRDALDPKSRR